MAATLVVDQFSVSGDEEPALSLVGGAHVGRSEQAVLRVEPHLGQVGEDFVEGRAAARGEEARDVFEEGVRASQLLENSSKTGPDPSFVGDAVALAGEGVRLTWEPRNEEIHRSTPGSRVESEEIRPERCRIQPSFFHFPYQDFAGVSFPLAVQNRASAWNRQSDSVIEPAESGAEGGDAGSVADDRFEGMIHTVTPRRYSARL